MSPYSITTTWHTFIYVLTVTFSAINKPTSCVCCFDSHPISAICGAMSVSLILCAMPISTILGAMPISTILDAMSISTTLGAMSI